VPSWVELDREPRSGEYGLDLSDIWRTTPLGQIIPPRRVLDLCAAPGGTSVIAHRYFPVSELIANEISLSRAEVLFNNLRSNLGRRKEVSVSSFDLSEWREIGEESFDLVIIDPPSSEQAKFGSDLDGQMAFDPITIRGNSERQVEILKEALELVAPGGYVVYTTSTFSIGENEYVLDKILSEAEDFLICDLGTVFRSEYSVLPCYRLFPHQGQGIGGFTSLIKRRGERGKLPDLGDDYYSRVLSER